MIRAWLATFGVLLGSGILLDGIIWSGQSASADRDRAEFWETHTREVLLATEALLSAMQDAETGQRGYVITTRPTYLEPYDSGRASADRALAHLADLTQDNAIQQDRLQADHVKTSS